MILDWADDLDVHYAGDDTPWCGLFVAHCVASTLLNEVLPSNPLGARGWEKFGRPVDPAPGAVMVFWRESRASGKGHVGFYLGEDEQAYRILGGNQMDAVCITWVTKDRFVTARWPSTAASLTPDTRAYFFDKVMDVSRGKVDLPEPTPRVVARDRQFV